MSKEEKELESQAIELGAENLNVGWDNNLKVWRADCEYDGTVCEGRGSSAELAMSALVNSMRILIHEHGPS